MPPGLASGPGAGSGAGSGSGSGAGWGACLRLLLGGVRSLGVELAGVPRAAGLGPGARLSSASALGVGGASAPVACGRSGSAGVT